MLGLLDPEYLADDHQHHRDVGRNAHELVGAHHDHVDRQDGHLRHLVLYYLLHPYYGRQVHLLLHAVAPCWVAALSHRDLPFPIILVIRGLWWPFLHNRPRLIRVLHLQIDLVLSLPLVGFLGELDYLHRQHQDEQQADEHLEGHRVGVEAAA